MRTSDEHATLRALPRHTCTTCRAQIVRVAMLQERHDVAIWADPVILDTGELEIVAWTTTHIFVAAAPLTGAPDATFLNQHACAKAIAS